MLSHFDHLVGLEKYAEKKVPLLGHVSTKVKVNRRIDEGAKVQVGEHFLNVMHTPGHRYDCLCLYGERMVFTSDTLFVHSYGRCDLEGSDPQKVYTTLHRLAALPEKTIVYAGHDYGPTQISTIGEEKKYNIFFHFKSKEDFLSSVGSRFKVV